MLTLLRDTVREWREDGANRLAAALAYYTTFSLAPLLVLIIAIAGLVGGQEAAQTRTMDQVEDLLGTEGREFVQEMIETASQTRPDRHPGRRAGCVRQIAKLAQYHPGGQASTGEPLPQKDKCLLG